MGTPNHVLVLTLIALGATSAAADVQPPKKKKVTRTFARRGVYFFGGPIRSPLAGLGTRKAFATNRVALDDHRSRATWEPHARKLVIRNTGYYEDETLVADVILLGRGTTDKKEQVPVGVHLRIYKDEDAFETSIYPHIVVRDAIKHAHFASVQVVLDDGKQRRVVLTKSIGLQALRKPFSDSTLARVVGLKGEDNLEGKVVDITRPGARLADGSIGLGRGFLSKNVLRAQLISLQGCRRIEPGELAATLSKGAFELRLTALSSLLPKEKFRRDLFLLGLDRLPMLKEARENGLEDGQVLAFTFKGGKGTIRLDHRRAQVKNAAEIVRRYLEFDFLGNIVRYQLMKRLVRRRPKGSR